MVTAPAIAPAAHPITDTAMSDGAKEKGIHAVVSLIGIKEMELPNKSYRICAA